MQRVSCPDLTAAAWHSSSYSNQEGGDCVQVADGFPGLVPVRDSKVPHGSTLALSTSAWTAFVHGVVTG
ncbi:DUF397 domain-containing protein [Streptomyces microflavus]|uniref:DUF397 domain-containing protein n=1 Tax=Streptomyces microflavus TaxID=1919 RepID=UPI0036A1715B